MRAITLATAMAMACSYAAASPADQAEAINTLRPEIRALASTCFDEVITPAANEVRLSKSIDAVRVVLTSSKGFCFGQPGQNTYLFVKSAGRWQRALSAEPGEIRLGPLGASGVATVTRYSLGMCHIDYIWSANRYWPRPSQGCAAIVNPIAETQIAKQLTALAETPPEIVATATESADAPPLAGPPNAQPDGPVAGLAVIVALTDKRRLPNWTAPDFAIRMRPYLTRDFLAAIAHGDPVAREKHLNIWDGDLITGAQGMVRAKLWKAAVVARDKDDVVVLANLSTSDTQSEPPNPRHPTMRYELKEEDGVWKIDDLAIIFDPDKPPMTSAKSLFSAPERYLQ